MNKTPTLIAPGKNDEVAYGRMRRSHEKPTDIICPACGSALKFVQGPKKWKDAEIIRSHYVCVNLDACEVGTWITAEETP